MKTNKRSVISNSAPTSVGGFTLIELLTVIAIVGILVAIIIPVAGSVRASAKQALCLSNIRQLHAACLLYSTDNKGLLPMREADSRWHRNIGPYTQRVADGANFRDGEGIYVCPSDPVNDVNYAYNGRIKEKRVNVLNPKVFLLMDALSHSTLGNAQPSTEEPNFQARHNGKGYVISLGGEAVLYAKGTLPLRLDNHLLWYGEP